MDTQSDVLDRIIELLKKRGLKQKDLTDHLGITKNSFTNWKNGNNNSYIKYASQIAAFLEVSTDYLFGASEPSVRASDDDIKFALFGTTDIDDELYSDVKRLAKIQQLLREKKDNSI